MITATHHGEWETYSPDFSDLPEEQQSLYRNLTFCRRLSDGKDFNEVRGDILTDTVITASAVRDAGGNYTIASVSSGHMCAFPGGRSLFTIQGWTGPLEDLLDYRIIGASGEVVIDPAKVNPVPYSVTRAQALIALDEAGLLEQVEALVASHPYNTLRLWWANAQEFERANAYLNAIALEISLTEEQVDDLFRTAATRA